MQRKIIFLFLLLLFVLKTETGFANDAAEDLASHFYRQSEEEIGTGQWHSALWALKTAVLLNPELAIASVKIESLEKELHEHALKNYLEGLRLEKVLRPREARMYWQTALQSVVNEDDPLKIKIERALSLVSLRANDVSLRGPEGRSNPDEVQNIDKMSIARNFLEKGDTAQTILSLKQIVAEEPENKRAVEVLSRLQASPDEKGKSENISQEIEKKFALAQELFEQAKQNREMGSWAESWQNFKKSISLFKGDDLKPPFFSQMEADLKECEQTLNEQLEVSLHRWEKQLAAEKQNLKAIGEEIKIAIQKYPPSSKADRLLEKVYDHLQSQALPLLMQANTAQQLEGCSSSVPLYTKVLTTAIFAEVPARQEAQRNQEACKMVVE
ncbi:MAG: hypothetical protein Q7T03_03730 [Deltaproteobacteria bacterium]|nr:hypothetical protein [Deltaproteobacteria bacterium]